MLRRVDFSELLKRDAYHLLGAFPLSPIFGILQSAGIYIGGSALNLPRWRMFRYLRIVDASEFRKSIENCLGLVVNRDETQTKLNSGNNKIGMVNIMVRCCSINTLGGKRSDFMPVLPKLPQKRL